MDLRLHPKTDLNASGAVYCRVQGAIGTRKERLKILSGFVMHFTPTSASWQSRVERFFRGITVNRLRRGEFTSVAELVVGPAKPVTRCF